MIRIPQVRVVDEEGAQLGVMPTPQALAMAQERGLDLVEVAPMAAPPVVKFLDFGQYKYELTKREKEAKRKQRSVTFKEVRLKPKIGTGDFDTKVRRAIQFLEEGDRIKVAVQFRGRELTHPEIGRNLLAKFADQIKDHGIVERAPLLEGKSMHITVASTHKPKVVEHAARHGEEPGPAVETGEAVATSTPAEVPEAPVTEAPTPAPVVEPTPAAPAPPAVAVAAEPEAGPSKPAPKPAPKPASKPAGAAAKASVAKATPTDDGAAGSGATVSKPATRPPRTRKPIEPEAPAAAPAGE